MPPAHPFGAQQGTVPSHSMPNAMHITSPSPALVSAAPSGGVALSMAASVVVESSPQAAVEATSRKASKSRVMEGACQRGRFPTKNRAVSSA
jgi:hypothetical protein